MALLVQKYGGTSVGTLERIQRVAERALACQRAGNEVVVVVSAMAGETNRLLKMAQTLHPNPNPRETDVLVTTGEQVSIALLSLAIDAIGGKARSFLADQVGMRTDNQHGRARILSVDDSTLRNALVQGEIAVVAGFQGVDAEGNVTTLGRGGSDTTAVALAAGLGAEVCEIYTDVDGIYTTDPRICTDARRIPQISYEEMLELASLGAKVLQVRSVEFAMNHQVRLHVRSAFETGEGSWVVPEEALVEQVRVRGVALDRNCAKLTLLGLPQGPGMAARVFQPLAAKGVNVDVIVQTSTQSALDLTFTVTRDDLPLAREVAELVANGLGTDVVVDDEVCKVSLVGAGMRSHPGVAAEAFAALAEADIPISLISTSEIKIACVIGQDHGDKAVQQLHSVFGLG